MRPGVALLALGGAAVTTSTLLGVALIQIIIATGANATEFPTGSPKIDVIPSAPISAAPGEEIVLRGEVSEGAPTMLVLRVDDGRSTSYATRVNDERELPPGPFSLHIPLAGMKTSGGGQIDAKDIRRLMLFEPKQKGRVRIDRFALEAGAKLPDGAIGFSFGSADAPVLAGLTRVTTGDSKIVGARPAAIRRPGLDPVVSNGIIGIDQLRIPWPAGPATVSLWLEDIGEWENLPRVLRRRIRINGKNIVDQDWSPAQWLAKRYLAGRDHEARKDDDAWSAYGRYRGGLLTAQIDVGDQGIVFEFAGDLSATFVSAVVVEPGKQTTARDAVEAARRDWLTSAFPVAAQKHDDVPVIDIDRHDSIEPIHVTLAPGSGARATFAIKTSHAINQPQVSIVPPLSALGMLGADLFSAQWRLERPGAGSRILTRQSRRLRGDPNALPLRDDEARRFELWISAPEGAAAGAYTGGVDVALQKGMASIPVSVELLPVQLPPAPAPAGFYLDEAPHLGWFKETRPERGRQLGCDLHTLSKFGVTGSAPGFATPNAQGFEEFMNDMRRASAEGTSAPFFAYTPVKRLLASTKPDAVAARLADVTKALDKQGLPAPIWSIADEPGNPDQHGGGGDIVSLSAHLRAGAPGIRLGAQFNNPNDAKFIDAVDTVLINDGYGVDVDDIAALSRRGREVWLYNTGKPRFTAGLWLWFTGARHYLQWHARMPTADPYDPTDGREGDVQLFPPAPEVCPSHPDIDENLLEMAEGVVDQRWLAWLSSRKEPAARALDAKIRAEMPEAFAEAARDGAQKAGAIRNSIMELARGLK